MMQARISTSAVSWLSTLARSYEVPLHTFSDMSGDDLIREVALFRWNAIVSMAQNARKAEPKERKKLLDELYYGELDEQLAYKLVKVLDEGDKEYENRTKERKAEERARKREKWQKGMR
jgi:hypothetical protein